ncbi:MAG: DUF4019 domain-containing protein [Verrucomicrobium sp.]|nr:DUF4019 domain-containing protein [Verrucomicrobium sp.]
MTSIRKTFLLLAFLLASLAGTARAADETAAAEAAMQPWLQKIDNHLYDRSWQDAAPSFQKAVTEKDWANALQTARAPYGKCLGRRIASASRQTVVASPTGAQQGDFVLAQFHTSFERLPRAIETVTFEKVGDAWKASGYYIKPGP